MLSAGSIVLGGTARTRDEAITEAGRLLVEAGAVDPSYVDAMHERETSVSTAHGQQPGHPARHQRGQGADPATPRSRSSATTSRWTGTASRPSSSLGIAGAGDDHLALLSPDRRDVHRRGRGGPAPGSHDSRRGARGARRRPGLRTPRGAQTGWTVTGTPFSAAFPLTSSRSGSVRSLIETPATVEALRIRVPADLVAVAVGERDDAGHDVVDGADLDIDGADP